MLYIATDRSAYLAAGAVMFGAAVFIAYNTFGHVQTRIDTWIDPWHDAQNRGYQLVQSLYGFGSGTSFASPEVAGAAALVWAAARAWSA